MEQIPQNKHSWFNFLNIFKFFILSIVFSVVSFFVKQYIISSINMSPIHKVGNQFFSFIEVHNTGAAFNLFSNHPGMIINASLITIAIIVLIVLFASSKLSNAAISSMALLSSGIGMNMLERVQYGYVVDYIQCDFFNNFPVFNLPDIMIVCGAIGLVLAIFSKD